MPLVVRGRARGVSSQEMPRNERRRRRAVENGCTGYLPNQTEEADE
jgi:hypothetical protein